MHRGLSAKVRQGAVGFSVAAKGASRSLDELSQAAMAADRGGLTAAGRALQKHGGREGSAFPGVTGGPGAINKQGQFVVDDILTSPGSTNVTRNHARFGEVTEIRAPDGRGVRYGPDGKFIGFLEP
jgi:filamentous hemagglutinin